ncbi:MAG: hypothetical protein AB1896_19650 [Thermodesulfobacteriota bacterium]
MIGYEEKPFWQSKTVWGVALTVVGGLLAQFGVNIPWSEAQIPAVAGDMVGLIGAVLAVYGRFRAEKAIRLN